MMTDEKFEEILEHMTNAVFAVGCAGGIWATQAGASDDMINIFEDLRSRLDWAVEAKALSELSVFRVLVDARAGWRGLVDDGRRTVGLYDTAPEALAAVARLVDTGREAEPEESWRGAIQVEPEVGTMPSLETGRCMWRGVVDDGRKTNDLYPSVEKALAAVTRLVDTGSEEEEP